MSTVGVRQSEMWKANSVPSRPQARISSSRLSSHQVWYTSRAMPSHGDLSWLQIARACPTVFTADRSPAYMGCSGSIASLTLAAAACASTAATPSAICLRDSDSGWPGSEPQTSTTSGAPSSAASSMQRRFSSIALDLSSAEPAGKNPPRQSDTMLRPWSRMSAPAAAGVRSAYAVRQTVMPLTPEPP